MTPEDYKTRLKTTGRNDACPCGSERKYKKCHLAADQAAERVENTKQVAIAEAALKAEAEAEAETEEGTDSSKKKKNSGSSAKARTAGKAATPRHTKTARANNLPRRSAI